MASAVHLPRVAQASFREIVKRSGTDSSTPIFHDRTNSVIHASTRKRETRIAEFAVHYNPNRNGEDLVAVIREKMKEHKRPLHIVVPGGSITVTALYVSGILIWSI